MNEKELAMLNDHIEEYVDDVFGDAITVATDNALPVNLRGVTFRQWQFGDALPKDQFDAITKVYREVRRHFIIRALSHILVMNVDLKEV